MKLLEGYKMTQNHRLSSELYYLKEATQKVISQHITPQIKSSPYLKQFKPYGLDDLKDFFIKTQPEICKNYPDLSYPQIQKILRKKQLNPTHHRQIKKEITDKNQLIIKGYKELIDRKIIYYKEDYKAYLKHPIKLKRPDKRNYQIPPFSASENPYTLDNFYEFSARVFENLDQKRRLFNIENAHYKLEADHQRERQLSDLEEKSTQYRQEQTELEQQSDTIRLKKALLKRKMEQLKHLTCISDGYNTIPDQVGMTSPEAQLDALEQLLAQKRRR